jgi:hypothetical protein
MRMNLIGYGCFQYEVKSGRRAQWPIVGLALQKNYISLYTSVVQDGAPITDRHASGAAYWQAGRMNEMINWVESRGAWLLVAGPLYQGSVEPGELDIDREGIEG